MEHPVLPDEIFVDIGKDRIRQAQLGRYLLTIGWGICTHCDHLCPEAFNLLIIFLQLTELRAAEPSSLGPVKDDQNGLFAFKRIQVDRRALDRKTGDIWSHALNLHRQKQSNNE